MEMSGKKKKCHCDQARTDKIFNLLKIGNSWCSAGNSIITYFVPYFTFISMASTILTA